MCHAEGYSGPGEQAGGWAGERHLLHNCVHDSLTQRDDMIGERDRGRARLASESIRGSGVREMNHE